LKANQIIRGLGWTTSATAVNVLAQLVLVAVLARQLEPAAFGLMLMANVALRFVSYFAQMGATQTLIQRQHVDARLVTATLVVALGVSLSLYAVVAATAPLFAAYFRTPELTDVLWLYGASLPLSALGASPLALLRRDARFRAVGTIEVTSYVLGYGLTGVACAFSGLGVWSLVAATLVQQALAAVMAFASARCPLAWPPDAGSLRDVFGVGARHSTIGFLEFLWANVESLAVGRWLGAAPAGLLNRAQLLANLPVEQAVGPVQKVLFPALSAMQSDRARMADGFLVLLLASAALSVALAASISAAAADVVALMLGPRWADAEPLVALLAIGAPAMFVYTVCGMTLDSLAALDVKLKLQFGLLWVKVALVGVLWSSGLPAVVLAVVLAEYLRTVAGLWLVVRMLQVKPMSVVRLLGAVGAAGAVIHAAVWGAGCAGLALGWPLMARLGTEFSAAAGATMLCAALALRAAPGFPPLARFGTLRDWQLRAQRRLFGSIP
jgi:O-antigen/teichoic acid export membrane protein